ncbi:MAG: hypothetical protein AAGC65_10175 [Mucilaginibacter sp.]|uniref:hypothetical protein n=1 Tax=Mucilaginibacter sp. TaxID=1882438 RepID=UPI0031AC965F
MKYTTGKAKPLDEITLQDVLEYPIWEWATNQETVEGQDETWQQPITNATDVTTDMVQPTITLTIKGTDEYASAEYNFDNNQLESIAIWEGDEWISIFDKEGLTFPLRFISIPTILGLPAAEFEMNDWQADFAKRI